MIECNDLFDYGLKIYQNKNYFKFSLDSILLAEFVKIKKGMHILDMCTGNLPVPMILYTKENDLKLIGVEIQPEICDLAYKTIKINNLDDKIKIINQNVRDINLLEKFDVITCNPPYFKINDTSMLNDNNIKKIARHEVTVTLEEIIETAKKNLKENGTFYLVQRVNRFLETIELLNKYKFGIRDVCFVYTKKNKQAEFFLIEASNYKKSDLKVYSINVGECKTYKHIFKEG